MTRTRPPGRRGRPDSESVSSGAAASESSGPQIIISDSATVTVSLDPGPGRAAPAARRPAAAAATACGCGFIVQSRQSTGCQQSRVQVQFKLITATPTPGSEARSSRSTEFLSTGRLGSQAPSLRPTRTVEGNLLFPQRALWKSCTILVHFVEGTHVQIGVPTRARQKEKHKKQVCWECA